MRGEFVFLADAGAFTECLTQASLPVAQRKKITQLARGRRNASSGYAGRAFRPLHQQVQLRVPVPGKVVERESQLRAQSSES